MHALAPKCSTIVGECHHQLTRALVNLNFNAFLNVLPLPLLRASAVARRFPRG